MRRRSRLPPAALLAILLAAAGCGASGDPAPQADRAAADTVLARLRASSQQEMRRAFERLPRYDFTRRLRTEQLSAAGRTVAAAERVVRYERVEGRRRLRLLRADSTGRFRFGFFDRFARPPELDPDPPDPAAFLLPEEPAFLSARGREAYRFRLLPDTTLWQRAAQVIEVTAHPTEGEDQHLRQARLYVDRATGQLVAYRMRYHNPGLLFREESDLYLALRPAPGGEWVPYRTDALTRLSIPFTRARRFRTSSTYGDYRGTGSGER